MMEGNLLVDDSQRNLIVNYLPSSLTPAAFKNMFNPFGEIESCRIILDKATGMPCIVVVHYFFLVD
jgi:RNA recognition motif-containing protein